MDSFTRFYDNLTWYKEIDANNKSNREDSVERKKLRLHTCLFKMIRLTCVHIFLELFVEPFTLTELGLFETRLDFRHEARDLAMFFSLEHFRCIRVLSTDILQANIHEFFYPSTLVHMIRPNLGHLEKLFLGKFADFMATKTELEDQIFVQSRHYKLPATNYYFRLNDFMRLFKEV